MTTIHDRRFTPFQKQVIREVPKLVYPRACDFEKTKTNHLKILVEGLDKPIFTSATPSDRRSLYNTLSEVQTKLRQAGIALEEAASTALAAAADSGEVDLNVLDADPTQKMINRMVRTLRSQTEQLEIKEQKHIDAGGSLDEIMPQRQALITQILNEEIAGYKKRGGEYLKPSVLRTISKEVLHQLNFFLPKLSDYKASLMPSAPLATTPANEKLTAAPVRPAPVRQEAKPRPSAPSKTNKQTTTASIPAAAKSSDEPAFIDLLLQKKPARIASFKTLSRVQLLQLQEELAQAMDEKHEEDLDDVLALIAQKGLCMEDLLARAQGDSVSNVVNLTAKHSA
ncbi:MAG: hypothetical protein ACRCYV_12065 [Aeromonas sp.]